MQKNDLPIRTEIARKPIGSYVLDFYCSDKKLAIELDGGHHNDKETKEYDQERTEFIEGQDIKVIRFWNQEVNKNIDLVIEQIVELGDL